VRESESMAVVIVSYNTRECLRACLISVTSQSPSGVFVVDNGSCDGSVQMVRAEFPAVDVLVADRNRGYGAAVNAGIARVSTPYALVLNADTVLRPQTIQTLADYLDDHPQVAIAGPRLVSSDGAVQRSTRPFPTAWRTLLHESTFGTLADLAPGQNRRAHSRWLRDDPGATPWLVGAALAVRRTAFNAVGGFDESFFMYYEETDLSYRLSVAGWETHLCPSVTVMHVGGASTSQSWADMQLQHYVSLRLFCRRHCSIVQRLLLEVVLFYFVARNSLAALYRLGVVRDPASCSRNRSTLEVWRRVLTRQY